MNILRNTKVKIFLTVLLVYLFYIAPGYLRSNTTRYIDLTKAIVDDKTFNIDETVYGSFSSFCKENGLSMSKQIELFMRSWMEKEPKIKEDYLKRLKMIQRQKSIRIGTIKELKKRYS